MADPANPLSDRDTKRGRRSASHKILKRWTGQIGRPRSIRCEALHVARRRTDDRKHLADVVRSVLELELAWPAEHVFNACEWPQARAFLTRDLTRTQAYDSPLMSPAWVEAFLAELAAIVPEGTVWFVNDAGHTRSTPEEIHARTHREVCPLSADRTFESFVAGTAGNWVFLFYAWDED